MIVAQLMLFAFLTAWELNLLRSCNVRIFDAHRHAVTMCSGYTTHNGQHANNGFGRICEASHCFGQS